MLHDGIFLRSVCIVFLQDEIAPFRTEHIVAVYLTTLI